MKLSKISLIVAVLLLIAIISLLRFKPWNSSNSRQIVHNGPNDTAKSTLTVGYLPVTCHLTCPVTDFASKTTKSNTNFNSQRFSDFPTVVSALEAKQVQATFMIVPLAMKLRED